MSTELGSEEANGQEKQNNLKEGIQYKQHITSENESGHGHLEESVPFKQDESLLELKQDDNELLKEHQCKQQEKPPDLTEQHEFPVKIEITCNEFPLKGETKNWVGNLQVMKEKQRKISRQHETSHIRKQKMVYHNMARALLKKANEMEVTTGAKVMLKIQPPWKEGKVWIYPKDSADKIRVSQRKRKVEAELEDCIEDEDLYGEGESDQSPVLENFSHMKELTISSLVDTVVIANDESFHSRQWDPPVGDAVGKQQGTQEESDLDMAATVLHSGSGGKQTQKMTSDEGDAIGYSKGQFSCDYCRRTFSQQSTVQKHIRSFHKGQPFQCSYCEMRFNRKSEQVSHVKSLHDKEKPHKCEHCEKKFDDRSDLKRHVSAVHLQARPYVCQHCGKDFKYRGNLNLHISSVHKQERPYPCQYCGKKFTQKHIMNSHVSIVHLQERPFQCQYCGKKFSVKCALKTHISIVHLEERPYQCHYCGRAFSQKDNLKSHIGTQHEMEDQAYVCQDCGKKFVKKRLMDAHVDRVHKQMRPHKCQLCGKEFSIKHTLRTHINSVHRLERPFECKYCQKNICLQGQNQYSHQACP